MALWHSQQPPCSVQTTVLDDCRAAKGRMNYVVESATTSDGTVQATDKSLFVYGKISVDGILEYRFKDLMWLPKDDENTHRLDMFLVGD
ncbi:hypothetical protein KIN20_026280 [Parelaphostrongylus tenuis]|uniref:Uncharacterized protein n=1 Tax=Parelaphostrongylus tenuis TaxID=148309 RepID=A0AAD5N0G5_PARTN|nr:hypothetical protein KIN20_026280 [Parelaphostrongylus tenuis]